MDCVTRLVTSTTLKVCLRVSDEEIRVAAYQLGGSKSSGPYNFPTCFIKGFGPSLVRTLSPWLNPSCIEVLFQPV